MSIGNRESRTVFDSNVQVQPFMGEVFHVQATVKGIQNAAKPAKVRLPPLLLLPPYHGLPALPD